MTREEFQNQILPAILSFWPRAGIVKTRIAKARENDVADIRRYNEEVTQANEKNGRLWRIVGSYNIDDALLVIRRLGDEHLDGEQRGGNYVLSAIRTALHDAYGPPPHTDDGGAFRPRVDPAKWTLADEITLWHIIGNAVPSVMAGHWLKHPDHPPCPAHWNDELWVASKMIGKNPCINERDEAYRALCRQIDAIRSREVDRGVPADEAAAKYQYPREVVEGIRAAREAMLQQVAERKAQAELEKQRAADAAAAELDEMFGLTGVQG